MYKLTWTRAEEGSVNSVFEPISAHEATRVVAYVHIPMRRCGA
jgi:hypothetical protein